MKKFLKISLWLIAIIFALMNIIAAIHAYEFTHFTYEKVSKTKSTDTLSFSKKLKLALTSVDNPRPQDDTVPSQKFETIQLQSNKKIECWYIPCQIRVRGTVILCHGYGGQKSSMLDKANEFISIGYNALLVDFMGSGGSEGNQTTIGYDEAEEVKTCYDYISKEDTQAVYLFGTSMGAAAILKCMHDYNISPTGIIIECPFSTMYRTVENRFRTMAIPPFPFAGLLTFWGGVENGFWAFTYKPSEYAKWVKCPTLLMYGAQDKKVTREETDEIYANLAGKKRLVIFPNAGHENYLKKNASQWKDSVSSFMNCILPGKGN